MKGLVGYEQEILVSNISLTCLQGGGPFMELLVGYVVDWVWSVTVLSGQLVVFHSWLLADQT